MSEHTKLEEIETFHSLYPFFYDRNRLWWHWNKNEFCWQNTDEIDLLNAHLKIVKDFRITKNSIKTEIISSMKMVGREHIPKDAKVKYIQFKNKVVNIDDGQIYPVENRFFFTNPIPWEIGESDETPIMDKLFTDWVGKSHVKTLYEIMAYCCYRDYPIQLLFCFVGGGRNGKTQFQKVLIKFLGLKNICSSSFENIFHNRFESFKLFKKLACCMGETNYGLLSETDLLKKITGSDPISFEKKQADAFDGFNYAKIMINSNSMPSSTDESDGFYRRWLIVDFPNQFQEGTDIMRSIPDVEYNNLCRKVLRILPDLLKKGCFTNQGEICDRKRKYIESSNPLGIFIDEFCEKGEDFWVRDTELYTAYCKYLNDKKRRVVSRKEFITFLNGEGYERHHTSRSSGKKDGNGFDIREYGYFIDGLRLNAKSAKVHQFILSTDLLNKDLKEVGTTALSHSICENNCDVQKKCTLNSNNNSQNIYCKIQRVVSDASDGAHGTKEIDTAKQQSETLKSLEVWTLQNNYQDNYNKALEAYGESQIQKAIKEGLIFENPKGWLKYL